VRYQGAAGSRDGRLVEVSPVEPLAEAEDAGMDADEDAAIALPLDVGGNLSVQGGVGGLAGRDDPAAGERPAGDLAVVERFARL
jgi:hypothetical protein